MFSAILCFPISILHMKFSDNLVANIPALKQQQRRNGDYAAGNADGRGVHGGQHIQQRKYSGDDPING